jgi:4-amino-4-deoxy-L-arabinose transferase-like glycosyltransferase
LSLPFFALLYWGKTAFESKLLFPVLAGASLGMALLSKSFAYIVPASLALGLFYWRWREWSIPKFLLQDLYKVILMAVLALGVFAIWFALDPFPEAVWKEFVLGENAGKFEARSSHYLLDLVRGGDSIWMLALTTLANAGLFTFVLFSALIHCWRARRFMTLEECLLLLLVVAFFIVFSLPSQRSGRYLLPVMPAFAALIALYWDRLPLWGFRIALLLQLILLSALTWVGGNLQLSNFLGQSGVWNYSFWHWGFMGIAIFLVLLGIFSRYRSKSIALAGSFLCYCALTSSLAPLEGTLGRYSQSAIAGVAGKDVWVPCDYRAKDEEYRLLLPGAILHGYSAKEASQIEQLSNTYPLVAVQSPIGLEPVLCEACKIVGQRMEMRARHSDAEIQAILMGYIGEHLFVNEYLISTPATIALPLPGKDACR